MEVSLPPHPTPLPIATKYEAGLKEQIMIGTLNFFQGKISRRLTHDIYGKSCPTKKSSSFFEVRPTIKSIWLAASYIWRAKNDAKHGKTVAEKRKIQKIALDLDIKTVLRPLHRKRIRYPRVPRVNKHSIPAKNMCLRISHLQLDHHESSMKLFRAVFYTTPANASITPSELSPDLNSHPHNRLNMVELELPGVCCFYKH
jgi:hypothetical protein